MRFEKLSKLIFKKITPKLKNNKGVAIFAKKRAKFEGWLKVELCEILSKYFPSITPERNRIDITFDDWAIQLKTVNTNYRYKNKNVENKTRPITMNIQEVVNDIKKLKSANYTNKAVLFVAFPVTHNNKRWISHLQKIKLKKIKFKEFKFKNKIPGVIYFGSI
jgi:hypothetical protein